ncbi:ERG4/ERG24 ergosterol biosynthesis-like protein [Lindgomyces ingoldianus]|uniref:ERG4/ERG24 ergosterol biosynthesis-like protein n=1 Tax=Lindgomyces ingoldianus TaxID=673940 RepID=A0ACB6R924_9PLEO|nr:ERG4/ERG24 ergosterol biosynthesis-like protein [Lindgomyces ingoldianus]KAF2475268.1 ERG4/ERG24 ergosterol biosynthesis-like protein [Lindgomyces ingoldianus]
MADENIVSKPDLKAKDFVPRGKKSSSPFNTTLFLGLRVLDCFVQYILLSSTYGTNIIKFLGGSVIPSPSPLQTGIDPIDALNLSLYRAILLCMISTTTAKHIWFVLCVAEEAWTVSGAVIVAIFNTFWNSLNNLLFLCALTSATSHPAGESLSNPYLLSGVILFVLGIGAEWQCEIHRKAFKKDPKNKGKPFTEGLFQVVRHPNYAGYSLWRAAGALATSGLTSSILTGAFFLYDFNSRAIPALDEYCSKRYGAMWAEYKKRTRSLLVPGFL